MGITGGSRCAPSPPPSLADTPSHKYSTALSFSSLVLQSSCTQGENDNCFTYTYHDCAVELNFVKPEVEAHPSTLFISYASFKLR